MNTEIKNLKQVLNSYQDQTNKIIELESKLKMQKIKYMRKIKHLEESCSNEIEILNRKLMMYHPSNKLYSYKKEKSSYSNNLINVLNPSNNVNKKFYQFYLKKITLLE